MPNNKSNTMRLARAYAKRTGLAYQKAFDEVVAARKAGKLPELATSLNLEQALTILQQLRAEKTEQPALDRTGIAIRLQQLLEGNKGGVLAVCGLTGAGKTALISKLLDLLLVDKSKNALAIVPEPFGVWCG